ncbi:hypothetical protein K2X33_15310 [bacterium]|nr:hypothetical protein [bacterium]
MRFLWGLAVILFCEPLLAKKCPQALIEFGERAASERVGALIRHTHRFKQKGTRPVEWDGLAKLLRYEISGHWTVDTENLSAFIIVRRAAGELSVAVVYIEAPPNQNAVANLLGVLWDEVERKEGTSEPVMTLQVDAVCALDHRTQALLTEFGFKRLRTLPLVRPYVESTPGIRFWKSNAMLAIATGADIFWPMPNFTLRLERVTVGR